MRKAREHLVYVTEGKSYLDVSVRDNLKDAGYIVTEISSIDVEDASQTSAMDQAVVMLIHLDEELLKNQETLIFIRDTSIEHDIPLFILGQVEHIGLLKKVMPKQIIKKTFERPIDIKDVISGIDTYVEKFGHQKRKNILIVDDSGPFLRSVRDWLDGRYQITLANSGTMAIKSMTKKLPDLILLDYEMPVVDGKMVLEMIRSEAEFANVPVIFLTSKNDKQSVIDVMKLKADGYLLKTMEPKEIIKAIDDHFDREKAAWTAEGD